MQTLTPPSDPVPRKVSERPIGSHSLNNAFEVLPIITEDEVYDDEPASSSRRPTQTGLYLTLVRF